MEDHYEDYSYVKVLKEHRNNKKTVMEFATEEEAHEYFEDEKSEEKPEEEK